MSQLAEGTSKMAEGTSYAGRVQIQQQLYGRFCRLCREPLSSDKYNLYRAWSLTKAGTLLSNITGEDLSLEAECAPQICKTCYKRLDTIAKQEDDIQKKRQLLSRAKEEVSSSLFAGRLFFTEGKRCRIPVSPRFHQRSPSTASPAPKRLTSTRQGAHCVRALSEQMHQAGRTQCSILAQPLSVHKWTQTELVREDIQLPGKAALEKVLEYIDNECDRLCSKDNPSSFRSASAMNLEKFSFGTFATDLQTTAPTVWSVLNTIAAPTGKYIRKSTDSHHPVECVIVAAAILLRERCVHMSTLAYLTGFILWQGNTSVKAIERLSKLKFTVSVSALQKKLLDIGKGFDADVLLWASQGSSGSDYQLVGDNVDIRTRPRYMTADQRSSDHHWFQVYAVKHRITKELPDDKPVGDIQSSPYDVFLPTKSDCEMLKKDFVVLISRTLVQYVPELKPFGQVVPLHVPHEMSSAMAKKSEIVPLGVITESEQEMEGMIEILDRLQQYVPKKGNGDPVEIFFTGDQLTCERFRGAKRARIQSEDAFERFAGMTEMPGDWHALVTFYQIIWELYSTKSARDKGTLYQLRTVLDRRNVVADPKNDFNACHSFLETVIDGYIVAAACTIFGVGSPDHITKAMLFPEGVPCANEHAVVLRAIEKLASEIELKYTKYTASPIPSGSDGVFNYSRLLLSLGLLARDFRDSWREGDGPRSLRLWKFLLLHFKQSGHIKYAYEAFRLLAHVNVTFTPKQAFEATWNRVCSTHNGAGSNIPLDLHMEHLNRVFKEDLKSSHAHLTERTISKTANAASGIENILESFDKQMQVKRDPGIHAVPDHSRDIAIVVKTLLDAGVFTIKANRCHTQFPCVPREPFSGAIHNLRSLQVWLQRKREEMALEMEHRKFKKQ